MVAREQSLSTRDLPASNPKATMQAAGQSPNPWILHPVLDLLLCCGGILWMAAAMHYLFGWHSATAEIGATPVTASVMGLFGSLLLSDPHNAATLVRLYGDKRLRGNLHVVAYWAPAALALVAAGALVWEPLLAFMLQVYAIFVAQHVTAQTYGIALIYCAKRAYMMTAAERKILQFLLNATALFAVVRQFAEPGFRSGKLLGLALPSCGLLPAWLLIVAASVVGVAALLFLYVIVRKATTERALFPVPALLLVATAISVFVLSRDILGVLWLYVPALFHAAQYLVVTTSCRLKELCAERGIPARQATKLAFTQENIEYWALLLFIGIALYVALPAGLTRLGIPFVTAFAAVFSAVNLHHFLADHAIWRMRDPALRKILVA